jgi:hypothetical protein
MGDDKMGDDKMQVSLLTVTEIHDFCKKYFTNIKIPEGKMYYKVYIEIELNFIEFLFFKFHANKFESYLKENKATLLTLKINYKYNLFGIKLKNSKSIIK